MTDTTKAIPARPRNVNDARRAASDLPPTEPPPPPIEEPGEETSGSELAPLGRRTLTDIHEKLCKPFPLWAIEVKPGATAQDKTRAMAMAYVDARAYQTRLDRLAGPEGWTVEYMPIGERAIRCRLTILGVVREDVGECAAANDENAWTSATMQAFKRACSAFGLGRYLYSLPKPWVEYDAGRKQFKDAIGAAQRIYELAGLPTT